MLLLTKTFRKLYLDIMKKAEVFLALKEFEERPEMVFFNGSMLCFLWNLSKRDANYETVQAAVSHGGRDVAHHHSTVAPHVSSVTNNL